MLYLFSKKNKSYPKNLNMKKLLLIIAILIAIPSFSQKKEKIKGSKVVVIQQKKVEPFTSVEILNNLEINLIKGDKCGLELEADDNLQDVLDLRMNGSMLVISFAKEVSSSKKFSIRLTYTDAFTLLVAKEKSKITALETVKLENISFKAQDNAKLMLNIDSKNCNISLNGKAEAELNVKSENFSLDLSKNTEVKALVSATNFKCDLYQDAKAKLEGDIINLKVRLDNDSRFEGKKLNAKNTELVTESSSKCDINSESTINISASGKSEIELYGNAKVDLVKFVGTAKLLKKESKN